MEQHTPPTDSFFSKSTLQKLLELFVKWDKSCYKSVNLNFLSKEKAFCT